MPQEPQYSRNRLFAADVDWTVIGIYLLLVLFGWLNVYAAVFDEDHPGMFDLSTRAGMQLLWVGISIFAGISVLLFDAKYWHMFSYPLYFFGLVVMLAVLLFGTEVNGARAWISLGRVRIQPVEFMKFVTALALARYMSAYTFNIKSLRSLYYVGLITAIPIALILLQNDTGSAMVFAAFFIMLYREGCATPLYLTIAFALLFLASFLLHPLVLLAGLFLLCLAAQGMVNRNWRDTVRYLALVLLLASLVHMFAPLAGYPLPLLTSVAAGIVLSLPVVIAYAVRRHLRNIWIFLGIFAGSLLFTASVDFAFDHILQPHQQKRIYDMLGIEKDPHGWSYNVIQSKIAIGSGGAVGKGFLNGTQTRFNFVPEQSTDFIFCTVGEEWGFAGSAFVVILYCLLVWRLVAMGERQKEPFSRIYCYCVASILFMHFAINIAMVLGIFPVAGIPLPFFSYGGSSLLAFSILLFVALRLDSSQYDEAGRRLL